MVLDVSLQFYIQVWISTLISKKGYPCNDILQLISVDHKYPCMDINVLWISLFNYPSFMDIHFDIQAFMDIQFDIHGFLWISMQRLAMDSWSREMSLISCREGIQNKGISKKRKIWNSKIQMKHRPSVVWFLHRRNHRAPRPLKSKGVWRWTRRGFFDKPLMSEAFVVELR